MEIAILTFQNFYIRTKVVGVSDVFLRTLSGKTRMLHAPVTGILSEIKSFSKTPAKSYKIVL